MTVFEWLKLTDPSRKGLTREQKQQLVTLRTRVCDNANTKIAHLCNAKCRGKIGLDLVMRMSRATKSEDFVINLSDEIRELP